MAAVSMAGLQEVVGAAVAGAEAGAAAVGVEAGAAVVGAGPRSEPWVLAWV